MFPHKGYLPRSTKQQHGVALIAMLTVISLILMAMYLKRLNESNFVALKLEKTQRVLAEAKQALLAYSAEPIQPTNCNLNCARPGDLPCPDLDNDGEAEGICNAQAQRLGRLPWKTLGLIDLKDGDGESLWYAVSNRYKNNTRVLPLNSETKGTISLRNQQEQLIFDGAQESGLVAVVIAPHAALTRQDNVSQTRSPANENDPQHYLDIALNEDNADFVDTSTNGFVSGLIKLNNQIIVNDAVLPITQDQFTHMIEQRVVVEVMSALLDYECGNNSDLSTRQCTSGTVNQLPFPALVTDATCLGNTTLPTSACLTSESYIPIGRIPSHYTETDTDGNTVNSDIWTNNNANSILRAEQDDNWFQQNNWRELTFYARMDDCPSAPCTSLTLNNALSPKTAPTSNDKNVVLISAGEALSFQSRNQTDKTNITNYLENDNINNPSNVFTRLKPAADHNDRALSIP